MYHDLGQRREKCVQQRCVTDIPNAGREPPRGDARVRSRGNACAPSRGDARDPSRGDGALGFSDLAIFSSSYGYCEGDPEFDERANLVTGDNPECIDAADQSAFMSLFGLSATSVMRAQMQWDAENRLAAYIPLNQSGGAKKVTFKYDYRGRRIEKNVYAWNSGAGAWYGDAYPTERRRYVWNGWLMLRETIETDANSDGDLLDAGDSTRVKTYTWGKDLGGGGESTGGIGGLLAVYDDNETSGSTGDDLAYVYMYDANGNVGQVCDLSQSTASASIVAKYEYDAYGNATVSSGSYASANTYRFSTKPWDDETGLGYWGYRYYDPRLGRWMSRDPIGEHAGPNIVQYSLGSPQSNVDVLGRCVLGDNSNPCDRIYSNPGIARQNPRGVTACDGNGKLVACVHPSYGLNTDEGDVLRASGEGRGGETIDQLIERMLKRHKPWSQLLGEVVLGDCIGAAEESNRDLINGDCPGGCVGKIAGSGPDWSKCKDPCMEFRAEINGHTKALDCLRRALVALGCEDPDASPDFQDGNTVCRDLRSIWRGFKRGLKDNAAKLATCRKDKGDPSE